MKKIKVFVAISCVLTILAFIICGLDSVIGFIHLNPSAEELLNNLPEIDTSKYNRFRFELDMDGFSPGKEGNKFTMSGALETKDNISHMYDMNICFPNKDKEISAETWADLNEGNRYTDTGNGFIMDSINNFNMFHDLDASINGRNTEMLFADTGSAYTLSWTFPTDSDYLFGTFLEHVIEEPVLSGSGRVTAVFDRETLGFEYFTVVASAGNNERTGALMDAVFHWDVKNTGDALEIPLEVSGTAYEASTGVINDGAYDNIVNPLAESFMKSYGGVAEVTHYNNDVAMFWTLENEGTSAAINYMKTGDPSPMYDESYEFLSSFYGEPVERSDNEAYFYDEMDASMTFMAKGMDWYTEVIITGKPGTLQGTLRKALITYKAKLGV